MYILLKNVTILSPGLHGSRYVTTHGVSLNCDIDLGWFDHIVPCGLEGVDMTSLSQELKQPQGIKEAIEPFLRYVFYHGKNVHFKILVFTPFKPRSMGLCSLPPELLS